MMPMHSEIESTTPASSFNSKSFVFSAGAKLGGPVGAAKTAF
jgi:hypothetical protein